MRRRRKKEPENHERWLVSYADFITLMFAFFVILYATSEQNDNKAKEFEESVKKYLIKAGAYGSGNESKIETTKKHTSVIEPPIPTFKRDDPNTQSTLATIEDLIEEKIPKDQRNNIIDIYADPLGVKISIAANKIYTKDYMKFRPTALPFVDLLAEVLKQIDAKILINGHTKPMLTKTYFASSWDQASHFSNLMLRYLVKRHNFSPEQLISLSYGDQRLIFDESSARYDENNRIELLIITNDSPI